MSDVQDAPAQAQKSEAGKPETLIEVRGLVSRFGERTIHDGLDLDVERGEVLGVVGGSGTGKTVLLNTIIGLKEPDGGEIRLFGNDRANLTKQQAADIEMRTGVLFQQGALFSSLSVLENVASPLVEHTDLPKSQIYELAEMKIAMVGLKPEARYLKPAELSGGMRKRVGLARALALDPELLFLDEPTAGVDVELRRDMWAMVRRLRERGVTVILTTHYIEEAEEMADRVGVILKGELILVEEKTALMKKLGKKTLTLNLVEPLAAVPPELAQWDLSLRNEGQELEYAFDAQADDTGVPALIRRLEGLGIAFKDLNTRQSSLEDIFVSLVHGDKTEAAA